MTANKEHRYTVTVTWTGDRGSGTSSYRAYERAHELSAGGKPTIPGSSDPAFRGDPGRWNPEELLVGALSACHQLWYLHLCAEAGLVVVGYVDHAEGLMVEEADGGGRFVRVVLRPEVTLAQGGDATLATTLHEAADAKCFLANSVRFPLRCEPLVRHAPP